MQIFSYIKHLTLLSLLTIVVSANAPIVSALTFPEKESTTTFTKQKYVEAIETVTIPSDSIPLTIGAIYNMFYTSSPTLWGQSIKLTSSMGNVYPPQFTVNDIPAMPFPTVPQPIIITNALGPVTITLTSLTGKVLATTTRNIISSCQSSLQDFNLSGMCTPSNPSLPSPHEASPGQATSTYLDPSGYTIAPEIIVDSTTQRFFWTPVAGASKYALYVRNLDTNVLEVIEENLTDIMYSTNVLKAGAHYKWNVRAKDSNGNGGWLSDGYWFKVREGVAEAPVTDTAAITFRLLDELGNPVSDAVVTVECYSVEESKCIAQNTIQGIYQTNGLGEFIYRKYIYTTWDGLKIKASKGGYISSSTQLFSPNNFIATVPVFVVMYKEIIIQNPEDFIEGAGDVLTTEYSLENIALGVAMGGAIKKVAETGIAKAITTNVSKALIAAKVVGSEVGATELFLVGTVAYVGVKEAPEVIMCNTYNTDFFDETIKQVRSNSYFCGKLATKIVMVGVGYGGTKLVGTHLSSLISGKEIRSNISSLVIEEKIVKAYIKRGWDELKIKEIIKKPFTTRVASNKATNPNNPATVFYDEDGSYVSVDNITKKVIQISDKNDPNWRPDDSIIDPFFKVK